MNYFPLWFGLGVLAWAVIVAVGAGLINVHFGCTFLGRHK